MPRRNPRNRNKGGRPCCYTAPTLAVIVAALARGGDFGEAATAAGVGRSSLYRWIKLSRGGDARFHGLADAIEGVRRGSVNHLLGRSLGKLLFRERQSV
jgi:hypothetical protein